MARTTKTEPSLTQELAATTVLSRPKLILPLGRGSRGKTLLASWLVQRAQEAGRAVVVADGDRTNQTLARQFEGVLSPPSASDEDMRDWVRALVEAQIVQGGDVLLDLGGGDLLLKGLAAEMDLVAWLGSLGIEVVALHLLGPSADDLAYLQAVEEGALLAPPATILVLNEGVVPTGRSPMSAFAASVEQNPILVRTLERGARLVSMPRLDVAPEIEAHRLTFAQVARNLAPSGQAALGPWRAQQVQLWLRRMEAAFAPVVRWLP